MNLLKLFSRHVMVGVLSVAAGFSTHTLHAQTSAETSIASSAFDEAWTRLQEMKKIRPQGPTQAESIIAVSAHSQKIRMLAWDIFESYPKEPRRWDAAIEMLRNISGYYYDVVGNLEKDGMRAFVSDRAARDAWTAYTDALYEQILAAKDILPETQKAGIEAYIFRLGMTPSPKPMRYREVIDEYTRRYPDEPKLAGYEDRYYSQLLRSDKAAAAAQLERMLASPNADVKTFAEGLSRRMVGKEIEMKFTALDGREFDISKMRGKVVLIDFWATWCGPCIAEFPNVHAVYDRYHAQGFEIIGISLDSARDRQKLIDFCREHNMPWPQQFDGKAWKNEFAQKFSINGIPAMLLIDKEGRIASDNARGAKLETEVKRLLGL